MRGSVSRPPKWTVKSKENWSKIANILNDLNTKWFTIGEVDLMATRDIRQCCAESYIKTLAAIVPLKPSQLPHLRVNWASDGFMVLSASGIGDMKSVTAALTGPKSVVLQLDG
jgi:hypothetical protein